MDEFLNKSYVLVDSENLQEYLEHVGMNILVRKMMSTIKQTTRLSRNEDNTYKYELTTPITNSVLIFTLGVEFDEKRGDGQMVKSFITFNGNIMTHRQTDKAGKTVIHVHEYQVDKMTARTTTEGFDRTLVRHYSVK